MSQLLESESGAIASSSPNSNARQMEEDFGDSSFSSKDFVEFEQSDPMHLLSVEDFKFGDRERVRNMEDVLKACVPEYDATTSISKIIKILDIPNLDLIIASRVLFLKHYPAFWVSKIQQTFLHKKKDVSSLWKKERSDRRMPKESVQKFTEVKLDSDGKPVKPVPVPDVKNNAKIVKPLKTVVANGLGVAAPLYWRVPKRRSIGYFPRPTIDNFSNNRFKLWVTSAAATLSAHLKSKKDFISADLFTESLYKGTFAGSRKVLAEMLPKVNLYIGCYKDEPEVASRVGYIVFDPKVLGFEHSPPLNVGGILISTLAELSDVESLFRRHKPLFRACMDHFAGRLDLAGEGKLRAALATKFKFTLEGNIPVSVNSDKVTGVLEHNIHHDVNINLPSIQQLGESIAVSAGLPEANMRGFIRFVSFVVAAYKTSDWIGFLACCAQFVSGSDYWYNLLYDKLVNVSSAEVLEAGDWFSKPLGEMIHFPSFKEMWTMFISCFFDYVITPLTTGFVAWCPSVFSIINETRIAMTKDLAQSLGKSILFAISEICTRVKSCISQRSIAPIWGERYDPRRWSRHAEGFITHFTILTGAAVDPQTMDRMCALRVDGAIPVSFTAPVSLPDYISICKDHRELGRELCKQFSRYQDLCRELVAINKRLGDFIQTMEVTMNSSSQRMAPFMLLFWGPPGGGKTNMAKMIARAVGAKNGFDLSPSAFYDWQEGVNFQDNLSHINWCVHMDDVDQGVAKDAPGVRNFVQNVIALVNNAPMPVEAAAVDMKGKIHASPRLLTYCTNFAGCNLIGHTLQPGAFWRRVGLRVYVKAKEIYSKGGGVLDPNKVKGLNTYELYDLFYTLYVPSTMLDENTIPFTPPIKISFENLVVMIQEMFTLHQQQQLSRLHAMNLKSCCMQCGLPIGEQWCSHVANSLDAPNEDIELESDVIFEGIVASKVQQVYFECRNSVYRRIDAYTTRAICDSLISAGKVVALMSAAALCCSALFAKLEGREANASNLLPKSWMRVDQNFKPGLPPSTSGVTYTYDELITVLRSCQVKVQGTLGGSGLIVSENIVLFPSHFAAFGEVVTLDFGTKIVRVQLTALNTMVVGHKQLYLLRCGDIKGVGSSLAKIWSHDDLSVQSFEEVELWQMGEKFGSTNVNQRIALPDGMSWKCDIKTHIGVCGSIYIGRFNQGWRIFAMHYMSVSGVVASSAVGAVFTRMELERCIVSLAGTLEGVSTVKHQISRTPEDLHLLPFPPKSEAWAAMSQGASLYPFGELHPPMKGSTLKTRMKRCLFYDDISDFEEEYCGEKGYWRFPEFRGKMDGDVWKSPYTNAFTAENKGVYDESLMWVSLIDYLAGVQDLDTSGWATLSENQAIVGVPGSYIHSMNLQTSAGPPFNTSKRSYVSVVDGEAYVDPSILRIFDELVLTMKEAIPAAFGICTLKDEPLKPGKMPRVFTCMSMAYNMLMKQHLSPVKSFMRANFTFFECAVGIDMTGSDAERIVRYLSTIDPSLTRLLDGDARLLDKAWAASFFNFVALVFYACGWVIGVDAKACKSLVLGVKHCRFAIKGDVFSVGWNPSGNDITVELNSVLMSLLERYVYYRQNGNPLTVNEISSFMSNFYANPIVSCELAKKLHFRKNVALVTYGDDNVKSVRVMPSSDYCKIWKDELGIDMTDATKASEMIQKSLADIQFLKRKFVWSEEYNRYITPLDIKSLMRTLVIKKDSILSDRDHACVAMTEVLRELVYHGREIYLKFLNRFNTIADKYGLRGNSYLILKPFDDWTDELIDGTFMSWVPRTINVATYALPQNVTNSDC